MPCHSRHRTDRAARSQRGDWMRSPNPHRLCRRRRSDGAVILGVCAGIADYFGLDVLLVRIAALVAALMFFPVAVFAYLVLALILPPRAEPVRYRDPGEEQFWRSVSTQPNRTFDSLKGKFRELEARLRRMEERVTREEFDLRAKFRDLAD